MINLAKKNEIMMQEAMKHKNNEIRSLVSLEVGKKRSSKKYFKAAIFEFHLHGEFSDSDSQEYLEKFMRSTELKVVVCSM